MIVFVSGGCGFIGHHLVNRLLRDQHRVIVMDRMDHCSNTKHLDFSENLVLIRGDLRSRQLVRKTLLQYRTTSAQH